MDIFTRIMGRAKPESLVNYVLYGVEPNNKSPEGTISERHRKYENDFSIVFEDFRKEIASPEWGNQSEKQIDAKLERLWDALMSARGDLMKLYFEMGFRIAFSLVQELKRSK